ncbi:MAG: AMP-binding protein, partial [Thermoanaerobaculia bacterium]
MSRDTQSGGRLPAAELSGELTGLVDILLRRAEHQPDRRAYVFLADGEEEAESFTYRALEESSRALAVELRRRAGAGERALLLYPPGLAFIPAFLACLRAGIVAVPASLPRPRRGSVRFAGILRNARPRLALTTAARLDRLRSMSAALPAGADLEWIATDAVGPPAPSEGCPERPASAAVAFLQYTSGATGDAKGVGVTHAALAANERAIQRAFGQSQDSVVAGWLPLHHDMGLIGNVLQPLWSGGLAVLMAPLAFLQRPRRWLAAIGRYRATTAGGPDFAYGLCVRKIPPAERRGLDLSSWRVAFDGAEPVRAATLDSFTEAFAPHGFRRRAFYPCYGLAEATLFVSGGVPERPPVVRHLEAAPAGLPDAAAGGGEGEAQPLVSSGRAWPGEEVVIVDAEGRPAAAGRVGEIWVAGPSVACSYWGREQESRATFGARFADGRGPYLRTGDLGLLGLDGELFVTGRLKDLMILRGRNIYPQDVETTATASHGALRPDAAAAFSVEADGEERMVVVCEIERRREREAAAAAAAVRRAVLEEHQAALQEAVLIRAGTLPRTTSGKVRRGACREDLLAGRLARVAADAAGGDAPPAAVDGVEDPIRRCAAEILEVEPAALDPAAPLGLDSLQAVELRNRLEADFAVVLPLQLLLSGASLRRLAEELRSLAAPAARRLPRATRSGELAVSRSGAGELLSWGQRSLWFLQRLAPESSAYHLVFAARVRCTGGGVPAPAEVRHRFAALAARHSAFSTTFDEEAGEPSRRRSANSGLDFAVVDAAGLDEAALQRCLAREARRPFDLRRGPLLRVRLFTAPQASPVLLFVTHHIAADFWSLAVVLEDIAAPGAEPPEATCGDHARWQRRLLAAAEGERLWSYWRRRLADGPPVLELPADFPRPARQSYRGAAHNFVLDAATVASLRRLAAASGGTLFTVSLAAFLALLHRLTGERDLVVGCPAAGRTRAGFEEVVGYFANLLPLRVEVDGA